MAIATTVLKLCLIMVVAKLLEFIILAFQASQPLHFLLLITSKFNY